jgi:hypothetical protein
MKSAHCVIIALALFSLAGATDRARAARDGTDHVFMWKVQGARASAYLLGSLHAFPRDAYPLDGRISRAYAACPRMVMEADPQETGTPRFRERMLALGTCPKGTGLKNRVSPDTYARVKERLKAGGRDENGFDSYMPWLAALALAGMELTRLGFDPGHGLDAHFFKMAVRDGKEMVFLETAEEQLDMLARSFTGRAEEDLLRQALDEIGVVEGSCGELMRAWKTGDAALMESLAKASLKPYPGIERRLFTERNRAWAGRIAQLLATKGDVFVVVGAGHLVGENGVLEMLRDRKLSVAQQ